MFSGSQEPYTACLGAITKLLHVTDVTQLKSSKNHTQDTLVRIYCVERKKKKLQPIKLVIIHHSR